MVDGIVLQGVKKSLDKIDRIKNSEELQTLLLDKGIDISTLNDSQIVEKIVKYLLTDEERNYYNQYNLYVRQQRLNEVMGVLDSLNTLTSNVDALYEKRKLDDKKINHINGIVSKIKMRLRDVPMIRISTLYGHLTNDYDRYSKSAIRAGMDESRMSDTIHNIEHGSYLLRHLKTKELARLKKELEAYKKKSSSEIEEKREKYVRTREEYTELLRSVFLELLRDEDVLNASLLSINMLFGVEVNIGEDYAGISKVDSKDLKEVSKVMIIDKFFEYFEKNNNDKFDAQVFYKLLEEFILYYYTVTTMKLEGQKNRALRDIADEFAKQKSLMEDLSQYQPDILVGKIVDRDLEDSLSLVYTMQNK